MRDSDNKYIAYVGTYTGNGSKGIYYYSLEITSGKLEYRGAAGELENPSYLTVSSDGNYLYSVSEIDHYQDAPGGAAAAYSIAKGTGELRFLNCMPTNGKGSCHLCVDRLNRCLFTANYSDGTITMFRLDTDGQISPVTAMARHQGSGPDPVRQETAHAHYVTLTPDEKYLCTVDLGTDMLMIYDFDPDKGCLPPAATPCIRVKPGSGPRHLEFSRDGRFAYLINELNSTITVLKYSPSGPSFSEIQNISTLPEDYKGLSTCAAIHVSPDGRYLYASNRGHDSIAVFQADPITGRLVLRSISSVNGQNPRDFAIDPTGRYLFAANQNSGTIVPFAIDPVSGLLEPIDGVIHVSDPACIAFVRLD
jgi:6-phosphogluconolactonase